MKAIIPVAGIGTRLQPITVNTPKVLINVAGKPMLFHLIDELIKVNKFDSIILIIGYLGEQIKNEINKVYKSSPVKFEFVTQSEMLGLAHAVYQAKNIVSNEPILIILGDTVFEFDLNNLLKLNYSAIGVKDVDDVSRFGIVETDNGFISKMIEKPNPSQTSSKSAIAGIYYIKNSDLLFSSIEHLINNNIKTKNEFQLTDALMNMVSSGEKFITFEIEKWFDCGKPETLLFTNTYLLNRDFNYNQNYPYYDSTFIEPVFIAERCNIINSVIGPNTTVCSGAVIENSIIKNSIIEPNAVIIDAELDNTVIAKNENVTGIHVNEIIADGNKVSF